MLAARHMTSGPTIVTVTISWGHAHPRTKERTVFVDRDSTTGLKYIFGNIKIDRY